MLKNSKYYRFNMGVIIILGIGIISSVVFAHGEQVEISSGARGPVHLSTAQAQAVDLKIAPATERPLASVLVLNGEIQLLPDAQADVSVRINGQISEVYATLGDIVKTGQQLAKIQSRLVGDPPPSVIITSPVNGIVDARNVNIGQSVEPSTVIFHISDRAKMLMVANTYEEDLGKVKVGQVARVRVISYPDKLFTGKVIRIEPNLDPQTRTVKVWIMLDNTENLLKPNLFGNADVILKENNAALTVPNAAVIEADGEKFVFVREGEIYDRVEVKTGASDDQYTEIVDGLVPDDEVVIQGNRQLYTLWLTGSASSGKKEEGH